MGGKTCNLVNEEEDRKWGGLNELGFYNIPYRIVLGAILYLTYLHVSMYILPIVYSCMHMYTVSQIRGYKKVLDSVCLRQPRILRGDPRHEASALSKSK